MSRAHMLYENQVLTTLPVKTTKWKGAFDPDMMFKRNSGSGLIIEGNIRGKSRHVIIDGLQSNVRNRYVTIHIETFKATKRKFDSLGKEIEPDFGSHKKVNTGYLSSSYKTVSSEGEDIVTSGRCKQVLQVPELDALNQDKFPYILNLTSVWCDEKDLEGTEIPDGTLVRLRTKGDGPYLESIVCLDDEKKSKVNYSTGETVGGSWTEKVLNVKDEKVAGAHLTEESEAVDDDEWD